MFLQIPAKLPQRIVYSSQGKNMVACLNGTGKITWASCPKYTRRCEPR